MGLWETIKRWFSKPKKNFLESRHPELYPLSVKDIAKELKLEDDARRFGEKGIPAPDATILDGPEEKIILRVENARQDYIDYASLRLAILEEELAKLDVTEHVNRARQADEEFERKASSLLSASASVIEDLYDFARRRQQELEAFRTKHHIERVPHLLTPAENYSKFAVLAFLVVVEGVFNAYFFSQGLAGGLIEGFFWAAAFALLNLGTAFSWGKFAVPLVFHVRPLPKILGFFGITSAVVWMTGVSLIIAHYRDALVADATNPAEAALEAIKLHPFGLNDINSWFLFGLSCVFAMSALYRGFGSDDPYPGYGKAGRRARDAREEYLEEVGHIRNQLEELKQTELAQLEEKVSHSQSLLSQQSNLIQGKVAAESRVKKALDDAEQCMKALLALYRNLNALHRNGLPTPAYFDRSVQMRNLTLPDFSTKADEAKRKQQQKMVDNLLSRLEVIRANIQASFNTKYAGIRPLNAHFDDEVKEV
jgi:hypothetical protein